jgi:RNA polymerase sigma-70 factor (ECF subfamily)
MSLKQIEELIGIKQNTVKTRLRRAKELLKDELKEAEQWMKN